MTDAPRLEDVEDGETDTVSRVSEEDPDTLREIVGAISEFQEAVSRIRRHILTPVLYDLLRKASSTPTDSLGLGIDTSALPVPSSVSSSAASTPVAGRPSKSGTESMSVDTGSASGTPSSSASATGDSATSFRLKLTEVTSGIAAAGASPGPLDFSTGRSIEDVYMSSPVELPRYPPMEMPRYPPADFAEVTRSSFAYTVRPRPGSLLEFLAQALRSDFALEDRSRSSSASSGGKGSGAKAHGAHSAMSTEEWTKAQLSGIVSLGEDSKESEAALRRRLEEIFMSVEQIRPVTAEERASRIRLLEEPFDLLEQKCNEYIQELVEYISREAKPEVKSRFPKKAQRVLYNWLKNHFDNPYPTKEEKDELVRKAGITMRQLTQWFTNARRRIWKPFKSSIETRFEAASSPL